MTTPPPDDGPGFDDLNLRPELTGALARLGYEEPTPIQRATIPALLEGRDLVGQAATGTGKTAAFALPILQSMADRERGKDPTALVLVPTRELAMQVSEATYRYGRELDARVLPIYGGQPIFQQLKVLARGVDVVVATPGRVIDHINRKSLRLGGLRVVVLDEADEMLDMGFAEDIEAILGQVPDERQTVLFSATMPRRIDGLVRRYLREPLRVEMGTSADAEGERPKLRQSAFLVRRAHKPAALSRVLDVESPIAAIVFCRTRDEVDQLTETLNGRGYRAQALHGGMGQEQRDRVMARLRNGTAELLVATDVAARGLDIDQLTHVVNYDVPSAPESYVHRVGRVGRAGREGAAITLAEPREHRMLKAIERATKQKITVEKVPTAADLRARRLELTRATLDELLVEGDLERFRVVVDTLSDTHDVVEIAMAAVRMAHEATGGAAADEDDVDIPDVAATTGDAAKGGSSGRAKGRAKGPKSGRDRNEGPTRTPGNSTRLYVPAGRAAGIRPGDLVGAIAGETSLSGKDIGAIEIADGFSLVEVPEAAVDEVIAGLKGTTLKGKRVTARRERF